MIKKVGVVGAGTMGSGIAALVASAGIPVVLLDIPGKEDRNEHAKRGLERALKARPAAFMDPERARYVEIGNTEDDLEKLKDCDWVVEAIIEKPEPKQALYARLEGLLKPTAIVSSNTSGIPMRILLEGRSEGFRRRFLGTHFFNPPRYLHLLELIPTPETDPKVLEEIRRFGERILGKGTVLAKDSPGFIANRLGVYGMVQAMRLMEKHGLTIDEVDALTGSLLGRPNSATFRTADLTGLDVLKMVAEELSEATGEDFRLPEWFYKMVEQGRLGDKTGGGFYKKENGERFTLDYTTFEYRPQRKLELPELAALKDRPLEERLKGALNLPGKYGAFLKELFARTVHYTVTKAPEIAYDLLAVDQALEWGFGWEEGPFKNMDALGLDYVRQAFKEFGLEEPAWTRGKARFYQDGQYLGFDGAYHPVPKRPDVIQLKSLKREGKVLYSAKEASILDLGDGVLLLEFHSKMNAIGEGVLRTLEKALRMVEEGEYLGLVIGNEDPRAFSAGANLALILSLAQEGEWDELRRATYFFQQATKAIRYSPFPVVVAPFGLTLGGGAEFTLHADHVQAHAELYIGLVEAGVGLLPAGGGTKEMLLRFTQELSGYAQADLFEGVRRAFELIATAKVATSALEAKKFGFLRDRDDITMNRDFLIADAKRKVLELAVDYRPPLPPRITVLGDEALGNLKYAVWQFREAGEITDHEVRIGQEIAWVLSGGGGPRREVSEDFLLELEREAFLRLLGTRKTQERIAHTLKTGKPLRN
ncbi:3-hydroxyacyl-CoA dehydrogenase [Thermus thermophilus]|uniref:3-hydroxyacyl-CoA dehydrogenase n=1 Tax=Thermus thermophilus TaxID=274 RepID=A0AAD1KVC7_THETH|nr:3-hydroxyacyl-CoA dehydrogenase/enoyl-CoA hydratase family protein [Thermus thermophilus]BCZ86792.1 3-hydroxyacyl-CoA dehydrogenase [Thermus thermophilus]BCZ91801.1 3-hydroxyacyl-CoA dehydrogenase [Thermus thermophilus]